MSSSSSSYTAELAYDPHRQRGRTTISSVGGNALFLNFFPQRYQSFVDKYLLSPLSIFTCFGIITILLSGYIALIPFIVFSKYIMNWPSAFNLPYKSKTNTSNTSVGSITAIKTVFARSQMYLMQCGGPDNIAPLFMNQLSLFGPNIPGSYFFTHLYAILSRYNFYLTGRVFADQLVEIFLSKYIKFGEVGYLQARTCWLDDVVDSFVNKHQSKCNCNVIILGAGYDSRCYRLKSVMENGHVKLYEIDAAGSLENKKNALRNARIDSSHVQFISCDFETMDWLNTLQSESDFDKSLPSLFIWEGVCMYLDYDVMVSTIAKIAQLGKGSCIAFDYFHASCINSTIRRSSKKIGEPVKSGVDDAVALVKSCNEKALQDDRSGVLELQIMEHLHCEELRQDILHSAMDVVLDISTILVAIF